MDQGARVPKNRQERIRTLLSHTLTVALTAAALTTAGGIYGTQWTNYTASENQRASIEEERRKADREKRIDVYMKFLAVTYEYRKTYEDKYSDRYGPCEALSNEEQQYCRAQKSEEEKVKSAFNDVYYFGSDDAVDVAAIVRSDLPSPVGYDWKDGKIPYYGPNDGEGDLFIDAYARFQNVVCRELSATPRTNC